MRRVLGLLTVAGDFIDQQRNQGLGQKVAHARDDAQACAGSVGCSVFASGQRHEGVSITVQDQGRRADLAKQIDAARRGLDGDELTREAVGAIAAAHRRLDAGAELGFGRRIAGAADQAESFPYRLAHTVDAVYITTGFVVAGVAASWLRRDRFVEEARVMLSMTLWLLTVLVPLQIFLGDAHGLNTLERQPAKLVAIEAIWDTESRVPLNLFVVPDEKAETNHYVLSIPVLGSLILTHDPNGTVKGLKDFPADQRPPVAIPFFAFRIMVGIGLVMLAIVVISWWLRWREELFDTGWFLQICTLASPLGFLAVLAGWTTTEVGRQPWTVYGLLRTADSVSPSLTGADVAVSFVAYAIVYIVMFAAGVALMVRIARRGPAEPETEPDIIESGRPQAPVEALPRSGSEA